MYEANDEQTTNFLAMELGKIVTAGDVIILTGDLGAGKTTFSKGIAKGLGISQMIKSPTYTIIREYTQGRLPFYHMDVYRLTSGYDDLGLDDYFEGEGLTVVEWGNQLGEWLPEDYLEIVIQTENTDLSKRRFVLKVHGTKATILANKVAEIWQAYKVSDKC